MFLPTAVKLLILLLAWQFILSPQTARAETLYRCVKPNGAVSYQNLSCAPGSRLDRSVDYQPDPAPDPAARPQLFRYRPLYGSRRGTGRSRYRQTRLTARPSSPSEQCRSAKARRRAELDRIGLSRTYEQLSRTDATVRTVCRGF